MNKGVFTVRTATLLFLGLFTTQAFAQNFCSSAAHSGTSTNVTSPSWPNNRGYIGDYHYELWYDYASPGSATFYSDGSMSCAFQGAGDYLCRSGLSLQSDGKTYSQYSGDLVAEYKLVKKNVQNVNYSYVGVYGWMENVPGAPNGLVEYYIVDNTLSQYMPGDWVGNEKIATNVSIDGGTYNVYRNTRTGPAIGDGGDRQFYQYFSVRSSMRDCGTINISAHMKKWEELGLKMGKLYEAKVLGEAGGSSVSGEMDFPHAKVYIANGSTPNSSSSTVQSSSSQNLPVVVSLPGSIEFEDYQNSDGDFATNANSLGSINPNSWVEYTVDFTSAGYYDFVVSAARQDQEGNKSYLTVSVDGEDIGTVTDILTAGWTDFKDFSGSSTKEIAAGEHTLRVTFDYGWIDADKITFTKRVESSSSVVPSSSSVAPSSSSVVPPSSSSVKPSSSSVEPPSSSSSEVPPSSSTIEPPPSSSSEVIASSETVEPPSSSSEISSSSVIMITSSEVITPLSSANVEILYSSSSFFSSDSNEPAELIYGPIVQIEPVVNQTTEAIGNIRMMRFDRNVQVFDMQGRALGRVSVTAGASLQDALFARFHKSGIYLVKQGSRMMKVRVTR